MRLDVCVSMKAYRNTNFRSATDLLVMLPVALPRNVFAGLAMTILALVCPCIPDSSHKVLFVTTAVGMHAR